MLEIKETVAMVPVKDLNKARQFYEQTLGLQRSSGGDDNVISFKTGGTHFNVYRSEFAGTNKATTLAWEVGSRLKDMVRELRGKGVKFEHYNMPNMKLEEDVYVAPQMKMAWFKDPDGNILSLTGN